MKLLFVRFHILVAALLLTLGLPVSSHSEELGTVPLTFEESLRSIGYPGKFGIASKGLKIAIVDAGFKGLDQWLDQLPEVKKSRLKINIYRRTRFETDIDHGLKVLRIAESVMPEAEFYLYETGLSNSALAQLMPLYVEDMREKGIKFANLSLGYNQSPYDEVDPIFHKILRPFEENKIFAVMSIGNERDRYHTWTVNEIEKGYIKITAADSSTRYSAQIYPAKVPYALRLFWESYPDDPPMTVILLQQIDGKNHIFQKVTSDGKVQKHDIAGQQAPEPSHGKPGEVYIRPVQPPLEDKPYFLWIKPENSPENFMGREMTLVADGTRLDIVGGNDGRKSFSVYSRIEGPYILTAGAFARQAKSRNIAPSDYSSFGITPEGNTVPHVLGPGSFVLSDGTKIQGTSYAAPFITAVLAVAARENYSPKNVAERISTHSYLTADPKGPQRSRYGVPDGSLILKPDALGVKLSPNKIVDISHRVIGNEIVFSGKISRCCMEGVEAKIIAMIGQVVTTNGQKSLKAINGARGTSVFTTGARDYDRLPVEVRVNASAIPSDPGELIVQFGIEGIDGNWPSHLQVEKPYVFTLP